ncbi:unnamed protein product [Adineta ricciae]|uniref:LisH domain-containing protein n=1 Tax=Adineta ricciae TaxID=249248 RepID=A0A814DE74_ADIRI|nr:unnamed protein product [Adineta ricciae]
MAEANLNYQTIKTTHAAREADDQRNENRKKNLIILVLHWLADEGYIESARQLEHETNLDVNKYDVCDNVDLSTILQEYESYFHVKFNRYPKLTKKNGPSTAAFMSKTQAKMSSAPTLNRRPQIPPLPRVSSNSMENSSSPSNRVTSAGDALRRNPSIQRQTSNVSVPVRHSKSELDFGLQQPSTVSNNSNYSTNSVEDMNLSFMKVSSVKSAATAAEQQQQQNGLKKKSSNSMNDTRPGLNLLDNVDPSDRLLKPLGGYVGYTSEWRELAEVISRRQHKEKEEK